MIEKSQNSSNISASINYLEKGNEKENKIKYLNKSDSKQIRELYSYNGNRISAKEGIEYAQNFKYHEIRIYNQLTDNLTKKDLHKMAKDIIDARNKQSGGKITGFYAIHQRPDGSNKHLHIVFISNNKKALEITGRGVKWQKELTKIELNHTKDDIEKRKVIEYYNKALQTLKSKLTGTEKIDKFILTHMNKKNENFSLKRASISIQKSKSIKNKAYYIKRLNGRLNTLEKQGIIKKIDKDTYKVDLEKFNKMIEERAKEKIEKNKFFELNNQLKNKITDLKNDKILLRQTIKSKFDELRSQENKIEKILTINEIENLLNKLNKIAIEEQKTKIELLDNRIITFRNINLEKEKEFLKQKIGISHKFNNLRFTTCINRNLSLKDYQYQFNQITKYKLSDNQINNILKIKYDRLEQLVEKGFLEKKNNEYVVKNIQKFREYIYSDKANEDRKKLVIDNYTNNCEFLYSLKNQINLKITINSLKNKKSYLYQSSSILLDELKQTDKLNKQPIFNNLKNIHNQIKQLTILEKTNKIEILDHQLFSLGNINLEKEKEFLKSNNLKSEQINNILKLKSDRLEQLVEKGYLEKKENEYVVKDKEKFKEYINSEEANKDRMELAERHLPNLDELKKEFELKIKLHQIRNQIQKKYNITKTHINILKSYHTNKYSKQISSIVVKKNFDEIHQLKIKENKTKIELLDQKLLNYNEINPFKGAEYLLKNTTLSTQKVREITELQLKRLEQLKRKGLVEKRGNTYMIRDKEKFKEYISSQKADKDRERIAKSKITNKVIKSKINSFIDRHSKIRPLKDFKSSYYHLSRAFGKSTGDRMVAFAVAVGYSIAKNSVKLAIKTAISVIRTLTKTTNKTIQQFKNKNFEKNINKKNQNKINSKVQKENNNKMYNNDRFSEKEDKFLREVEKNREEGNKIEILNDNNHYHNR